MRHIILTVERKLLQAINKINSWAKFRGFTFSRSKTVSVHFHRKRGLPTDPALSLCNNQPIKFKKEKKFLGLIFDHRLYWNTHIKTLKEECTQALNLIKCLSGVNWSADRASLRLYRATVREKLDYGCQAYPSAPGYLLDWLNSVHNAAIRIRTGAFHSSPIPSLLVDAGEMSLENRRRQLCIRYYLRVRYIIGTQTFTTVINNNIEDWYNNNETKSAPFGIRRNRMITECNIPEMPVLQHQLPFEPLWQLNSLTVCNVKYIANRSNHIPAEIKYN